MREHARLARPGAGEDEQRALEVLDGLALRLVQAGQQRLGGGRPGAACPLIAPHRRPRSRSALRPGRVRRPRQLHPRPDEPLARHATQEQAQQEELDEGDDDADDIGHVNVRRADEERDQHEDRGDERRHAVDQRDDDRGVGRGRGDVGVLEARQGDFFELAQRAVALGALDQVGPVETRDAHGDRGAETDGDDLVSRVDAADVAADEHARAS